jgi:hypothetical protein
MHHGPVFGDDVIEQASLGKDLEQLTELSRRHQQKLSSRRCQHPQCFDTTLVATTVSSERSIETGSDGYVSHAFSSYEPQR